MKDDEVSLLPCPFCGERRDLCVQVGRYIQQTYRNSATRVHKRRHVEHYVLCGNCLLHGPLSPPRFDDTDAVSEDHMASSRRAAVSLWNTRVPVNDRVWALIDQIIIDAHAAMRGER